MQRNYSYEGRQESEQTNFFYNYQELFESQIFIVKIG